MYVCVCSVFKISFKFGDFIKQTPKGCYKEAETRQSGTEDTNAGNFPFVRIHSAEHVWVYVCVRRAVERTLQTADKILLVLNSKAAICKKLIRTDLCKYIFEVSYIL